MPPIFNKMETSWNALANDFKNAPAPKSLASRAEINTDLTGILDAELELVKTITNDSLDYVNSTQTQRNALKSEV